ncbi:hypothetical protein NL676_019715 [Syzygium grande]|nr:hypothetical protein NL676_019715 [Syzygium grande]
MCRVTWQWKEDLLSLSSGGLVGKVLTTLWDSGDRGYGGSVFCFHGYPWNGTQTLFGIFAGHRGVIATEFADLSKYIKDEVVRRDQDETKTVT